MQHRHKLGATIVEFCWHSQFINTILLIISFSYHGIFLEFLPNGVDILNVLTPKTPLPHMSEMSSHRDKNTLWLNLTPLFSWSFWQFKHWLVNWFFPTVYYYLYFKLDLSSLHSIFNNHELNYCEVGILR